MLPLPLHAKFNGAVPAASTASWRVPSAHTGELLVVPEICGTSQGVPMHAHSALQASSSVRGSPSSQGVPGSAVPPSTPRQSLVQSPPSTDPLVTVTRTSCPPKDTKLFRFVASVNASSPRMKVVQASPVTGMVVRVNHSPGCSTVAQPPSATGSSSRLSPNPL